MRCPCCKQVLPQPPMPRNAFKPWNRCLDEQLQCDAAFYRSQNVPVELAVQRMASFFGRSENSIYCRLRKFDLITE